MTEEIGLVVKVNIKPDPDSMQQLEEETARAVKRGMERGADEAKPKYVKPKYAPDSQSNQTPYHQVITKTSSSDPSVIETRKMTREMEKQTGILRKTLDNLSRAFGGLRHDKGGASSIVPTPGGKSGRRGMSQAGKNSGASRVDNNLKKLQEAVNQAQAAYDAASGLDKDELESNLKTAQYELKLAQQKAGRTGSKKATKSLGEISKNIRSGNFTDESRAQSEVDELAKLREAAAAAKTEYDEAEGSERKNAKRRWQSRQYEYETAAGLPLSEAAQVRANTKKRQKAAQDKRAKDKQQAKLEALVNTNATQVESATESTAQVPAIAEPEPDAFIAPVSHDLTRDSAVNKRKTAPVAILHDHWEKEKESAQAKAIRVNSKAKLQRKINRMISPRREITSKPGEQTVPRDMVGLPDREYPKDGPIWRKADGSRNWAKTHAEANATKTKEQIVEEGARESIHGRRMGIITKQSSAEYDPNAVGAPEREARKTQDRSLRKEREKELEMAFYGNFEKLRPTVMQQYEQMRVWQQRHEEATLANAQQGLPPPVTEMPETPQLDMYLKLRKQNEKGMKTIKSWKDAWRYADDPNITGLKVDPNAPSWDEEMWIKHQRAKLDQQRQSNTESKANSEQWNSMEMPGEMRPNFMTPERIETYIKGKREVQKRNKMYNEWATDMGILKPEVATQGSKGGDILQGITKDLGIDKLLGNLGIDFGGGGGGGGGGKGGKGGPPGPKGGAGGMKGAAASGAVAGIAAAAVLVVVDILKKMLEVLIQFFMFVLNASPAWQAGMKAITKILEVTLMPIGNMLFTILRPIIMKYAAKAGANAKATLDAVKAGDIEGAVQPSMELFGEMITEIIVTMTPAFVSTAVEMIQHFPWAEVLLPIADMLVKFITDVMVEIFAFWVTLPLRVADIFLGTNLAGEATRSIKDIYNGIYEGIMEGREALYGFSAWLDSGIKESMGDFNFTLGGFGNWLYGAMCSGVGNLASDLGGFGTWLYDSISTAVGDLSITLGGFGEWLFGASKLSIGDMSTDLGGFGKWLSDDIKSSIGDLDLTLGGFGDWLWKLITGKLTYSFSGGGSGGGGSSGGSGGSGPTKQDVADILTIGHPVLAALNGLAKVWPFAEGGIVTAPTLGLVGEAGPEAIIPLSKFGEVMGNAGGSSSGPVSINVTIRGNVYGVKDLNAAIEDGVSQYINRIRRY